VKVDYVVAVVRDGGLVSVGFIVGTVPGAQPCGAPGKLRQRGQLPDSVLMAEWCNFDRQREREPEARAQLGFVHDAYELVRGDFYHFFAEQRAPAALDEAQVRIDGVCAVNCHVHGGRGAAQRAQRDPPGSGLLARTLACGDADDVRELSILDLLPDSLDGKVRRGASAQPHDHAAPHVILDRLVASGALGGLE